MKKVEWLVAFALFLSPAMWAVASPSSQSPFDGTWHTNLNESKLSPKPISFYIGDGWYHCTSCDPEVVVKADGKDHAVTGQDYDTISVKQVDPKSVELTIKKGDKTISEQTRTVSENGKILTVTITSYPMDGGAPVKTEVTAMRVGMAPDGVPLTSGSWRVDKVKQSENAITTTFKSSGDELTMSDPTGEAYTAKLDGKDYPVKGAYAYDQIQLKKIDARTIEETDLRDGKVVGVAKMTVSPNGKEMTVVYTSKPSDRTSTYVANKG